MKKITRALALTFGLIAAPFLTGCARNSPRAAVVRTHKDAWQQAAEKLGTNNYENIRFLRNGYKTTESTQMDLRLFAGVKAGTAKLEKTPNGYNIQGTYSEAWHPEAMDQVCKEVDTDGDKYITRKEMSAYKDKFLDSLE